MDETLTELVLRTVELVPPGRMVSYGDVVALLGTGPRQVGAVMAREGHGVQWWRVTNASGDLPTHLMADDFHAATADLKRQLPRIPLPDTSEDFRKFVEAGEHLLELHIRYEEQPEYPLGEETVLGDDADSEFYRVKKLRWGTPYKSQIVMNDNITLTGIPDEAHEYVLGSRSALEWILDRYQVKTDKASETVNDPNDWGLEHGNPRYIVELIKKVTHVSVETVKIVKSLPKLTLKK